MQARDALVGLSARGLLWAGTTALCGAALAAALGNQKAFVGVATLAAVGAIAYLSLRWDPAWPLSIGIAASVFSGNWTHLGVPVGLDRVILAIGVLALALQRSTAKALGEWIPPLRMRAAHWMLLAASLWAVGSAYLAGTLIQSEGLFGLLDRFGLIPFAMFVAAPLAFAHERQRRILLGTLAVLGAYLGVTALLEAVGLKGLTIPSYIADPSVGIHADRARGPFVEAVGNGLGLYAGGLAGVIGALSFRRRAVRAGCALTAVLCAAGLLFTLTRSVWLAAAVSLVITGLVTPELRRWLVPAAVAASCLVLAAFASIPGLSERAQRRSQDRASVWVRENTNHAAVAMVAERPIAGFGWDRFRDVSMGYFSQLGAVPLNGVGEGVHNVFLARAAELGLIGAALWLGGFLLGIGGALVARPPPELRAWRAGLLAFAIAWVVVAAGTPLPYAFPTLVLWTCAGLMYARPEPVR